MKNTKGTVYLVGAGPGDPKLITVKGLEVLQRAHVVVYDHLVSPRLLDHVPAGARLVYVGKEPNVAVPGTKGARHRQQEQINRLLVRAARAGKVVVRLKGGDPVLFGRGGEEALALARAKIPYEIVPGVTSAIAVPAYAGIPVTHRHMASSVAMLTGHEDPSKPERAIRWDRLATATDTLVCLMGVSRLRQTIAQLVRHGRPASTPCAVVEWGTLPRQRTVVGTLGTIVRQCERAGLRPPAIVVVGDVVRLRRRLNWFETKPLFGRRIVVTRPTDRASDLADQLEALGAEVVRLPAIELQGVAPNGRFHRTLEELDRFDWVFFTSPEGIRWFERLLRAARKDLRVLRGRQIGAIGPKTADSIRQLGIHVDFVPKTFSQEGMLAGLAARRRLAGRRALILSAKEGRDVLAEGLRRQGMDVRKVPIYQTLVPATLVKQVREIFGRPVEPRPAAGGEGATSRAKRGTTWVTATSSSCVEHLTQALASCGLSGRIRTLPFASIGPVTSATIRRSGGRVVVEATRATIEGLVDAIVSWARQRGGRRRGISQRSAATIASA